MNISDAAQLSGVSAKMIRYYESIGLISAVGRKSNGYRDYSDDAIAVLQFVRRARSLGFSVDETRDLVGLWQDRARSSRQVKKLVEAHVVDLSRRIEEMKAMRDTLAGLARACAGDERPDCPILIDLAKAPRRAARRH
ncbi:MAG: Cu(I)-responsive transcriptional regulator [Caulobacterales bacterium]